MLCKLSGPSRQTLLTSPGTTCRLLSWAALVQHSIHSDSPLQSAPHLPWTVARLLQQAWPLPVLLHPPQQPPLHLPQPAAVGPASISGRAGRRQIHSVSATEVAQ